PRFHRHLRHVQRLFGGPVPAPESGQHGFSEPCRMFHMSTSDAALSARRTWRTLEPVHAMIYFVPEAASAFEALGIRGSNGYFASRSAPMGAVSAEVVTSTFFNFNPELVREAIPSAWDVASPDAILEARLKAV